MAQQISYTEPTTEEQPQSSIVKKLLLVVAVVVLLTALLFGGLYLFKSQKVKQRDNKRKADINALVEALEKARATSTDQKYYPSAITSTTLEQPGFINNIPVDSINKLPYIYTFFASPEPCGSRCTGYSLRACLENKNDKGKDTTEPVAPCATRTYQISR